VSLIANCSYKFRCDGLRGRRWGEDDGEDDEEDKEEDDREDDSEDDVANLAALE